MEDLEAARADIAVETTLASRSLAPRIARLKQSGYRFQLLFMWLPNPEIAVSRVAERVRRGGHHIPEEVIRRRYVGGLHNFFERYQPMADSWRLYNNESLPKPRLIASGSLRIRQSDTWNLLRETYDR